MGAISTCPVCAKQVALPAADPTVKVRCPLCHGEFTLQEVLDLVPPMLEILPTPFEVDKISESLSSRDSITNPTGMTTVIEDLVEDLPRFSEPLTFDAVADEDEELDTELEGKAPSFDELIEPVSDEEVVDLQESPADESPFGLGGPMFTDAPETIESPSDELGEPSAPGVSAVASAVSRRKREPSMIGTLIGVVGGGLLAIPLALFAVIWIKGPSGDVAGISKYMPKWMLPAAFSQTQVSALMPMAKNPTPADLDEVKQAAGGGVDTNFDGTDESKASGDDKPVEPKLPFAPDNEEPAPADAPESPEVVASDSSSDATAVEPFAVKSKKPVPATEEPTEEEMPDEPAGDPTAPNDSATADTATFEEPTEEAPSQEEAAVATEVGPKELVNYSAADLADVINAISKLRDSLADADSLEPGPRTKLKGQYYRKLYRLGDVVTFAADADHEIASATDLLTELGSDSSKLNEIGKAGVKWLSLDPAKRSQDKGVLLAGTVEEVAKSGNMYRVRLLAMSDETPVSVYSASKPKMAEGDKVLVLGSIFTDPKESLHNFADDDTTVVWYGLGVKVDH